jgi:hypothetical protein
MDMPGVLARSRGIGVGPSIEALTKPASKMPAIGNNNWQVHDWSRQAS